MSSFVGLLCLVLVTPGFAFAQQSINFGTIGGTVEDSTGAVVAGAPVEVINTDRNQSWSSQTDSDGRFRTSYLPVGSYEIHVNQDGFQAVVRRINLSIGQALDIPISLAIAGVTESVMVTDSTPTIETLRTQIADTILTEEIEALPLNGRNYLDLALLVPAVSRTNTGNNERFAETSAVPGTGISVAGQRNLGNGFIVDGLSANDDAADLAGTFLSQEVIREFQVVRSGGIAEFGRAYSGVVNVVTQSGTNQWRGALYGFVRNHRLDATNLFAPLDPVSGKRIKSSLTQAQYGASLGGPLKRDRTFLFANLEREDLNRSGFVTISPANVQAINAYLDETRYAGPRIGTGAYPTGNNRSSFFLKADINGSDRSRFALRYNLYDIFSPNARGAGGLSAVSRGSRVAARDHTIAGSAVRIFSNNAVNELRSQFTRSRFEAPGNDLVGPAVSISGIANFGASTTSPTARDIDLFEIADSYSVQKASHYLKAGIDLIYNRVNIVFPATVFGTYSFGSLPNFLAGNYTTFGQAFGKIDWFQTNPNLGWFVQDEWRPRPDITINAGIRHDVQWLADPVQTSWTNFGPRLGISYAPGDQKTVVRSGFGIYYDRIPLRAVANALRGAGVDYKAVSIQRTQTGAPVFPDKLSSVPAAVLINLTTMNPSIRTASGLQANLEIEREIARHVSASIGFLHMRGLHIIMQRNLNVPTVTAAVDPINLGRPNPNFGNITEYSGQGDSYYDGMTASLELRGSTWAGARVSYTLSKAIDNTGNAFFNGPQDNFNIRGDRGLSDNDQRHRLALSGQINARLFQVNSIFTYASPYPFNVVTGGQTLQTTTARVPGLGRNTGKGFSAATLDLRLSRRFRLTDRTSIEAMAESFNTLNRTNLQFPNNTWGTGTAPLPTFGLPTAASDPRQIQFGLRVRF